MALVKDVMEWTDEIVPLDEGLPEAAARMRANGVVLLPVVDGDEIVGVVTVDDIQRTVDDAGAAPTVRDRLSPEIAYCYASDDVATARTVMNDSGRDALMVTDDESQLLGYVTRDAVRAAETTQPSGSGGGPAAVRARTLPPRARATGHETGHPTDYAVRPTLRRKPAER